MLSIEQGVYVAETVVDKNLRRDRGRFKMYGDWGDEVSLLVHRIPAAKFHVWVIRFAEQ